MKYSGASVDEDALDALAVVLERFPDADLQALRRLKAKRQAAAKQPPSDAQLEKACEGVATAWLAELRQKCPDLSQGDAENAISALVDIPPPSVFASQAVDLSQLMEEGVPEPAFLPSPSLDAELFYDHVSSVIAGHKKSGKSWMETVKACDLIRAKRHVVYIDQENGAEIFAERLVALKVTPKQIEDHFHYVPFPKELPPLDQLRDEFEKIATMWPDCLVVLDSMRGLMTRYGLKSNEDTEVGKLLDPIMAAVKNGPPMTVDTIDHSNRSTKDGDAYAAAGSFAKACAVDVVYFVEKVEPFSVHKDGLVKISAVDDRRGRLDFKRYYKVGGQGGGNPIRFIRANENEVGTMGRIRADIENFLIDQPKRTFTQTTLCESIKGTAVQVRRAADLVVAANRSIHKDANPGRKGSWIYSFDEDRESDGLDL